MRIALFGAGGQLAHDLTIALSAHEIVPLTRSELDLRAPATIADRLRELAPEFVINSAAYNLVDQAEDEPAEAFAVNALAPRVMASTCAELDIPLLHFGTDYVFGLDPLRDRPWTEEDAPGPVSVYGASKLMGEYAVRALSPKHFVLRTCGLYGVKGSRGKGGNFVETMLRLGKAGKPLRVVDDQHCTPSNTVDVARAAVRLLETDAYGLYHVTNAGETTWYRLAKETFERTGLEVDLRPITSKEFGAKARRPAYSVLSGKRLESVLGEPMPIWTDALARYLASRPG